METRHYENLVETAKFVKYDVPDENFNMSHYLEDYPEQEGAPCGSVGCAVGWGTVVLEANHEAEYNFAMFAQQAYGMSPDYAESRHVDSAPEVKEHVPASTLLWGFLFSSCWGGSMNVVLSDASMAGRAQKRSFLGRAQMMCDIHNKVPGYEGKLEDAIHLGVLEFAIMSAHMEKKDRDTARKAIAEASVFFEQYPENF